MKIKKIELNDYKLFKGKHIFEFNDNITLIKGPCGSGKTILFNAIKKGILNKNLAGVNVEFKGDIKQFKKHINHIFIDNDQVEERLAQVKNKTNDLSMSGMMILSFFDIMKESIEQDLPLVIDYPFFSRFDETLSFSFLSILSSLRNQVIWFGHDRELEKVRGGKEYHLKIGK